MVVEISGIEALVEGTELIDNFNISQGELNVLGIAMVDVREIIHVVVGSFYYILVYAFGTSILVI